MHHKRLITALIFLPLVYLYIMYLPPKYALFLLIFFSTLALAEYYAMSGVDGLMRFAGLSFGIVLLSVDFFKGRGYWPDILLLAIMVIAGVRLFSRRDTAGSIMDVAYAVLGLVYIPGLLFFQVELLRSGPRFIILLYGSVWAADSAAYYIGKGIGKRKLYPEVSPNKTIEGAVGSVIGGGLGALFLRSILMGHIPIWRAVLLGLAVGSATIVGDLVESMFKRDAGAKDSGGIIPGHGGILDKLDGALFAGPVFYWICLSAGIL